MAVMISFSEAQRLLHQNAELLASETVPVASALYRVLAEPVQAQETIPPFANSAMDRFAVRHQDVQSASNTAPIRLRIAGSSAAGEAPKKPVSIEKTAWRIMTGAAVPAGYDAVYPIENVTVDGELISVDSACEAGAHIRKAGEDFAKGETFAKAGRRVTPAMIAALASTGIDSINVVEQPRVLHFATGSELVESAQTPLQPGQIRNSNSPFLQAALASMPVRAIYGGQVRDEPNEFITALQSAMVMHKPHVVLTTGAVSAGDFDFIPRVIAELGGEIIFHKCTIKPGKPILFARLPNNVFFFGLPGNPVSTAVGLRFFVTPFLRRLQGLPDAPLSTAMLRGHLHKPKADWRFFLKARCESDDSGRMIIEVQGGQESHKIKPLIDSNAWLVLDEGRTHFANGDLVHYCSLLDAGLE